MQCPVCGRDFDPADRTATHAHAGDLDRIKYCSETCARRAENRRYYQAHKASTIKRARRNQKRARRK